MGKFYGINNYTEHPRDFVWDPRRGPSITTPFIGTPSAIDALLLELVASGKRLHRTARPDGGYSLLQVCTGAEDTQGAGNPLAVLWDLDGNDIEKSLWEKPAVKAMFAELMDEVTVDGITYKIPSEQSVSVRRDIMDMVSGQKVPSEIAWWATASLLMQRFVAELLQGVETYWVSHWVLRARKIICVANLGTVNVSKTNVDKVYASTTDLAHTEGIPDEIVTQLDLPAGVWLKKSPKRDAIGPDKWQITQEWYWADDYSSFAYNPAVAPPS